MTDAAPLFSPPATITKVVRFEILARDKFKCVYCGKGTSDDAVLQIDHFVPKAAGGTNHVDNLVTSCRVCNVAKGNRVLPFHSSAVARPHTHTLAELLDLRRRAKSEAAPEPEIGFNKTAYQREYMRKRRAGEAKTIRVAIDAETVEAFKAAGPDWLARMNDALRASKPV